MPRGSRRPEDENKKNNAKLEINQARRLWSEVGHALVGNGVGCSRPTLAATEVHPGGEFFVKGEVFARRKDINVA